MQKHKLLHSPFLSFTAFQLHGLIPDAQHNEWLAGCRRGNRKAQEALYKAYYRSMMTLCMRYTKNEADALEALNSGFLKIFQNISKFDASLGSLYTWMRALIIRSCLDHIRGRQHEMHSEPGEDAASIAPDIFSTLSAAELLQLVRKLPPATQAVFNLYVIDGYQHKEIGALLGISEGTSKWHLSEARRSLQKMIGLQEVVNHE